MKLSSAIVAEIIQAVVTDPNIVLTGGYAAPRVDLHPADPALHLTLFSSLKLATDQYAVLNAIAQVQKISVADSMAYLRIGQMISLLVMTDPDAVQRMSQEDAEAVYRDLIERSGYFFMDGRLAHRKDGVSKFVAFQDVIDDILFAQSNI